jgi:hypothetical protein
MAKFRFGRHDYEWRKVGRCFELVNDDDVVARVVPDDIHPGMHRVEIGVETSDMANLTRARDAALHRASQAIERCRSRPAGAPQERQAELAL